MFSRFFDDAWWQVDIAQVALTYLLIHASIATGCSIIVALQSPDQALSQLLPISLASSIMLQLHVEVQGALRPVDLPALSVRAWETLIYFIGAPPEMLLPAAVISLGSFIHWLTMMVLVLGQILLLLEDFLLDSGTLLMVTLYRISIVLDLMLKVVILMVMLMSGHLGMGLGMSMSMATCFLDQRMLLWMALYGRGDFLNDIERLFNSGL